jgi:hypothetical protein
MKKTSISNVDRVIFEPSSGKKGSSKPLTDPSQPIQEKPQSQEKGSTPKPSPKKEEKKGPGIKRIFSDDFLEELEKTIKSGDDSWNIGEIPIRPGESGIPGIQIDGNFPGAEAEQPEGDDTRVWVDPKKLESEIDRLNEIGEEAESESEKKKSKEKKTSSEKSTGKGGGAGGVREKIKIRKLARTDWASIFKTRLSLYSDEKEKFKYWDRRLISNPALGRRVGSFDPEEDVLPEVNVLIDTSSSLSYKELEVILSELSMALQSTKIEILNVFLWESSAYAYKSFTGINSRNFEQVLDWIFSNWRGGGNDDIALMKRIIKEGKAKNLTIHLTDAYIGDYNSPGKLRDIATQALDYNETISGIIFPNQGEVSLDVWDNLSSKMPGDKIPIFMDTTKFLKPRKK